MSTDPSIQTLTVKLSSKADYADWLDAAESVLDYIEILQVVKETQTPPADAMVSLANNIPSAQKTWDKRNKWARTFLIQNIGREVHREIEKSTITSGMWNAQKDLFDRMTTCTLH